MPSNITAKLYLGDILLCPDADINPTPDCVGRYGVSNSYVVNFESIIYNQQITYALFQSSLATTSYQQLYVYNSGLG